jgi:hypothetical protein
MRRGLSLAVLACCLMWTAADAQPVGRCLDFSGTADSIRKPKAVEDSVASLTDAVAKWKATNGITGPVTQTAMKPEPHPYWRSTVATDLLLPPDTITDTTYTICWKGVVSPVVCTTGAKVCW